MADTYYPVGNGTIPGRELKEEALGPLLSGWNKLKNKFDNMTQMRDGDGSQAAHYAGVKVQFAMESDADAKALYDEMNSTLGNSAALIQLLARTT